MHIIKIPFFFSKINGVHFVTKRQLPIFIPRINAHMILLNSQKKTKHLKKSHGGALATKHTEKSWEIL